MDSQTYDIIGAAIEVHRELGCGFLEAVYQEALKEELSSRAIPYRAEVEMPIFYKSKRLKTSYRADFICNESVIVELKAISKVGDIETAQVLNYLRAGRIERGLLFNFGAKSLEHRRFVQSSRAGEPNPKKICVICEICGSFYFYPRTTSSASRNLRF
jgi:GxxExxY protein